MEAVVEITTGEGSGAVIIRAALPFDFGGATDNLEIEVQAPSQPAP